MSVNTYSLPNSWTSAQADAYESIQYFLPEIMKLKLPEFQRDTGAPIDGYVQTAGEMFDEMRTTIRAMSGYLNWADAPLSRIDALGSSFGIDFPRNLNEETRRTVVRDIVNIYKKNGTPDTLKWIFKIIGWNVDLQYAWVKNPDDLLQGKESIRYNGEYVYDGSISYGELTRADLDSLTFTKFVYGNVVDVDEGTFFFGRDYFDEAEFTTGDPTLFTYQQIPIQGESYPNFRTEPGDPYVASTPYIVLRVTEDDYRLFTEDYVDPETGITYSYTDGERFQIAQELIDYLLFEQGRPVQVRVILISVQRDIDQVFPIYDFDYNEVWTNAPYVFEDLVDEVWSTYDETVPVTIDIGDSGFKIGPYSHPYSAYTALPQVVISPTQQILSAVDIDTEENIQVFFETGDTGLSREYTIRAKTYLTISVPAGVTIDVQTVSLRDGIQTYSSFQTLNASTTYTDVLIAPAADEAFHGMRFDITGTVGSAFSADVRYEAYVL